MRFAKRVSFIFFLAFGLIVLFTQSSLAADKEYRVGEVAPGDTHRITNRVKSKNHVYLGFGPANFQNLGTSSLGYDLSLGYNWETTSQATIRAMGNGLLSADTKSTYWDALLGLNLYLNDADISPYLFGGFGFAVSGTSASQATTVGGFAGAVGVGYGLFRTSSTEFDILADYHQTFANNTIGSPGFFALKIGVLF